MTRGLFPQCLLIVALSCAPAIAATQADQGPTADSQKNDKSDLATTAKIRKAIVHDKTLSIEAHNIKIVTQAGNVTLRGHVKSDDEKQAILAKTREIAGNGNIDDELEVVPPKQ
jgi:hyperosmotically inducible periplasmic protein